MIKEKIELMLENIAIPYKYHHFTQKEAVAPPFIIYRLPVTNNFSADNIVYKKTNKVIVEFYFEEKDEVLEEKIEETFNKNGIFWERTEETFIDSEKMYVVFYEFQL